MVFIWFQGKPLVKSIPEEREVLLKQLKDSPWILLGWGVGNKSEKLKSVIFNWFQLIDQSGTPTIGKMRDNIYNFYHPRPQLKTAQDEYRKFIKEQYDNIFKNK